MNRKTVQRLERPWRCQLLPVLLLSALLLALVWPAWPVGAQALATFDPSTLLGGGAQETAYGVAVDGQGAIYVVGSTASSDFPITPGALDSSRTSLEAFVAKFSPGGSLEYATLLGGRGDEAAYAVAVEGGIAYVTGETTSPDFPGTGGTAGESDAFVVAVNQDGSGLLWATLLGGSDQERGYGLAVEGGSAYVTGITYSADFPGGSARDGDAFVARVDAGGAVGYSTLLSGSDVDAGFAVAVRDGQATVVGETSSWDWPAGTRGGRDGFVARINRDGGVLWNLVVGGMGDDRAQGLGLDANGAAYVTGWTTSPDFPAAGGTLAGATDAFALKVSADGTLSWALLLGGSGADEGRGIALDADGSLVVAGATGSADLPVSADAPQAGLRGAEDAFLLRLEPVAGGAPALRAGTYLGGSGRDRGLALALDPSGAAWVAGLTQSSDFETTEGAVSRALRGGQDAFLSRWGSAEPAVPSPTGQPSDTPSVGPSPTTLSGTATATRAVPSPASTVNPTPAATGSPSAPTGEVSATPPEVGTADVVPALSPSPEGVTPAAGAAATSQVALQASPSAAVDTPAAHVATSVPTESAAPVPSEAEPEGNGFAWIWALVIAVVIAAGIAGWVFLRKH